MQGIKVMVVPETPKFKSDTTYRNQIYINSELGKPDLKGRNAKYVAPFWLQEKQQGVNRVYYIENMVLADDKSCYIITLGNSFVLKNIWNNMGNHRKFEYHDLIDFGFVEIKKGLLMEV